jgi:hypothetical protein
MKRILFILVLGLVSGHSIAQDQTTKPHFIRLAIGPSIPVGVYGKSQTQAKGGDYALIGFATNLEGAFFFTKNWGLGANLQWASHPVSDEKMEDFTKSFGNYQIEFEPRAYRMATITGGVYYYGQISSKFALVGNLSAGILNGQQPKITFVNQSDQLRSLGTDANTKSSFAYQLGVQGIWQLNKHWQLGFQTNLVGGSPKFEYLSIVPWLQSLNYRVNFLSVLVTTGYRF